MLNRFKIHLGLVTLVLAVIVTAFLLRQSEPAPLEFDSHLGIPVMSPAIPVPAVTLLDQNSQPFQTDALRGRWNLVFFGYTNCPDICPTTLNSLKQAAKQLPDQALRYIFVSLDPGRDSPNKLKEYLKFFNPAFIGLTGDKTSIDQLSNTLGVIYDYEGDISNNDYLVNHYAAILVIDPQARLRAHILPPHPASKIVPAITRIIEYYGD